MTAVFDNILVRISMFEPLRWSSIMFLLALIVTFVVQGVAGKIETVILMQEGSETLVEIAGRLARIGGMGEVVGELRMVTKNCTKSTQPANFHLSPDLEEWVGVIYLPSVEETIKEQTNSKPTECSLLDQVKNAMLLGASALIVLAMNPVLLKELDVQQLFKQPVVSIQEAIGINRINKAMQSKANVIVEVKAGASSSHFYYWTSASLTLWATCGRSNGGTYREWEGVVCLGSGHSQAKIFPSFWTTLLSVVGTVYLLFVLHGKWILWGESEDTDDVESCLQRLAKTSLSRMPARKYKRKRDLLSRESCAICLEEFTPGKLIRVLPCYHRFHCKCVDDWLINKRTCPLCKLNIVDHLTKLHSESIIL